VERSTAEPLSDRDISFVSGQMFHHLRHSATIEPSYRVAYGSAPVRGQTFHPEGRGRVASGAHAFTALITRPHRSRLGVRPS